MNEGGIAGALSGAVGLAALGKIPTARFQVERTADIHESTIASSVNAKIIQQELATNSRGDSVIAEKGQLQTSRGEQKSGLEFFRSLEIKAEKLDLSEATLRDRVRRLGEPVPGVLRYYVAVENGAEMAARSKDFNEFVRNGGMRNVQDTVRHYAVGSGQTITISESYAAKLDEVLALRLKASEPLDPYLYGVGHAHEVAKARVDLKAHPWANMAHPADFVSLLEELPDRTLVKDLFIRHDRSPGDAWTAKEFSSPDFKAAATASQQESRIAFYGQERSELMRYYLKHEWGHLLKWAANTESTRFDQAAILEKDGYYVSDYSKRNNDENWAEHAANLLDPDTDHFVETAHGAPLRTVEIGRALLKSLVAVPHGIAGTHQAEVSARINYIQERIIPAAQDKLISIIKTGNEETAPIAARLLSRIAGREQLDALADLAKTHTSPVIRKAAFAAGWEASEKGVVTLSGYNDIAKAPSDSVMRDFLLSHAEPDSLSRDVAIQKLGQMQDNSSRFHYDMLTLDQHPSTERLKRSLILMDAAPDTEGLKQAFAEALKSVEGNPNERVNLALRALDRFPRLVADSVDILATEAQPRTRPFLRDLTNHYNEKIARLAAEGLRKVDLQQRLEDLGKSIQSASATETMNAVESLAALRSSKAAAVLVDSYISSSNDVERAGISSAMRRYISPEIWKFEVRRQKQQNPSLNAVLDKLMNPRG